MAATEDSLTREAFLAYFETFEELECPRAVQQWVDRFGITDLHWRRPRGAVKEQMPQERGKAYPLLSTVFIGEKAGTLTWFHELGHVVYPKIDKEQAARLAAAARERYSIISSDDVSNAIDPDTMETTALPKGSYLKLNGQFYGLDHSGLGVEAENDELWASLFGEYCAGFDFPPSIRAVLEEIILGLTPVENGQTEE